MIFAMSDIHGHYDLMKMRMEQIKPMLEADNSKLILLGDYIDGGNESYQCLQLAYDLEQEYGADKVIVLKGNHEVWFEEFLFDNEDIWLEEDGDSVTSKTFLTEEQFKELNDKQNRNSRITYVGSCIKENHKTLLSWMRNLRLFYETDSQIYVHAGVDEDIPEEEMEWCTIGTSDEIFTGKYPPSIGHFYIDGSTGKNRRLLCLAFDEKENNAVFYVIKKNNLWEEIAYASNCNDLGIYFKTFTCDLFGSVNWI